MKELVLVAEGKARASVAVVGSVAAAREAHEELIETVRKATGATLSSAASPVQAAVVLAVGESVRSVGVNPVALPPQGFQIRCDGRRLVIAARDSDGLYYGVCAFLERALGVRWLWPGPTGEVIPRRATLAVPEMAVTEGPDYLWRHLGPGGPLYRQEDRWQAERRLGTSEATQEAVRRWMRRNRMDGLRVVDGHAWGRIVPPEQYAKTHPEYFALVRGERATGPWDGKHGYQLCTTNPQVIQHVVCYCRQFFDAHPEVDVLSISPNDGLGFCECERCKALDPPPEEGGPSSLSDRMMAFAGAVAEEVRKTHPNKLLLMLVYSQYQEPPRRAQIPDNLIVQYCAMASTFWNPTARETHLRRVRALGQAARHLGIYEYYIEGAWPDLPRLLTPFLADSIREFHAAGARYYCPQAGNGFAINGWNYYLAARLLWNIRQDPSVLLEDYCRAGFGNAAATVRRYLESVAEHWATTGGKAPGDSRYQQLSALFPPERLAEWRALLEQALIEAGTPEQKQRVAFLRRGLNYVEVALEAIRRTAAIEVAGLPVSSKPEAAIARLRAEGKWPQVEALIREAAQAWEARDALLEDLRDDVVVSHMWIRYNDWERGFHPRQFFQAALRASGAPTAEAPPASAGPTVAQRYAAYLRQRIEERPGPRIRPDFPSTRDEWLAFSRQAREKVRQALDFPAQDCPLNPRVVSRQDFGDYVLERVIYFAEPFSAVPAHLYLPKTGKRPAPALIFPSGHGGSKSKFYNQYAGQLYARAGVVCLIPDPPGEEERDEQCRMGIRGHRLEQRVDRGLAIRRQEIGKFVYDLVRGVDYLCTRPEVDRHRIGCTGHSLGGTLTMYLTAADERIRLSMPSSWTAHFGSLAGEISCCWRPFGLLQAGDQPELVALGAPHCATLLLEGEVDYNERYHEGRQRTYEMARPVYRLFGREEALRLYIEPKGGHRPYFLTPEALSWVCQHFGPLRWTAEEALHLPTVRIGEWAQETGAPIERAYASEADEGGARAVAIGARYVVPEALRCLKPGEWERAPYSLASWFEEVERGLPPTEPKPATLAAWQERRETLCRQIAQCLNVPEIGPLKVQVERTFSVPGGRAEAVTFGAMGLGALLLLPSEPGPEGEAILYLDASRSREAALESPQVAEWLRTGKFVLALDSVGNDDSAYLLGESPTAHNVAHVQEAIQFLRSRPEWGVRRIVCHSAVDDVGLLAALLDERIESLTVAGKAGERDPRQGYRRLGTVPGLTRIAGRATLLALIAPRPLRLLLPEEPVELARVVYRLYEKEEALREGP